MKRLVSLIVTVVAIALAASAATPPWVAIGNQTSVTIAAGQSVMTRQSFSDYFVKNNIITGDPFPDNGLFEVSGSDPGNCILTFVQGQLICSNYRFRCAATAAEGLSSAQLTFYLVDLNAEAYHQQDDPRGTCYLSPITRDGKPAMRDGKPALLLLAIFTAEPSAFNSDRVATMGWFNLLAGGILATQPQSGYLQMVVQYNPRPGDPASFTFGGTTTPLNRVFTLTTIGNAYEPIVVNGTSGGVFTRNPPTI